MLEPALQAKLDTLPASSGVYVFKGHDGEYLYVGKAANLRSRVRSYFQGSSGDTRFFIGLLHHELGDLETFVTETEKEAALLENSLIKEHQPRYNFKLRDDKDYLSLRLDPNARWPRLQVVRRPRKDGALYFGPYHSATAARSTLRTVNRHFQLRTCTDSEMSNRSRPCLQYQIKRCPAPCVLDVDREQYGQQVRNVAMFLEGRHDELVHRLRTSMRDASDAMEYELAAVYRDQLRAVESARERQSVSLVSDIDQDVFGFYRDQDKVELAVLMARRGKVVGVRTYALRKVRLPDDELLSSFLTEYYAPGSFVPDELLLPARIEAMHGTGEMLSERRGRRVKVRHPQRGPKARLVRMAMENAAHAYREKVRAREDTEARLAHAQQKLGLPALPRRVECLDISHLGGQDTVGVLTALFDGEPDRKRYRSFHVRGVSGGDDYGAMYEVLSRRFKRGRQGDAGWALPDLLVVDGGKGQLAIAQKALDVLGLELPLAALAKEKESPLGETQVDRLYRPGRKNPIPLRDGGSALSMFAVARDEAHRASNALREKLGKRRRLRSGLDDVPGVGPKTRRLLLRKLGSLRAVREADVDTLVEAGCTRRQAEAIHGFLHEAADTGHAERQAVDNAFA